MPTDAGTPGINVVDLSTGATRSITPALPGGFALQGWLTDGIHVSVPCGNSTGLCGYVIDPHSGTATARPAKDGDIRLIGSPDGTQELVVPVTGMWTKVVAGPAGGALQTIYTAPAGKDVFPLDIGDDGSILTAVGTRSSWEELILADGSVTTATPPKWGWAPAGMAPDPVLAIPGGGFVAVVWTGPGPSVQELVRVMPDGSTSIIEFDLRGHRPADRASRLSAARPSGFSLSNACRIRKPRARSQESPRPLLVTRRKQDSHHSGGGPEQEELTEDEPEDRAARPARTPQHPDLSSPASDGRDAPVHEEQGGDQEDEGEEGDRLLIQGRDDYQGHPLRDPVLVEEQRRAAVLAGRELDRLGGGRGARGGVHLQPRRLPDRRVDNEHAEPAFRST